MPCMTPGVELVEFLLGDLNLREHREEVMPDVNKDKHAMVQQHLPHFLP